MRMTIARKLAAGLGIVLLPVVIVDVVIWINAGRVDDRFERVITRDAAIMENARYLERCVVDMETGVRGFCLTQEEEFLEPFEMGHKQFHELLDTMRKLLSNRPAQIEMLAEIERLHEEWIESTAEPEIAAARQATDGDLRNVAALVRRGTGKKILDRTREELGKFIKVRMVTRDARYSEVVATVRTTRRMILILALSAIVLGTVAALGIARSIVAPVNELVKGAEAVGRGELDHRIHVKGRGELAQLAVAFNSMVEMREQAEERSENLNRLLRGIRNVNRLVAREKDRERLLDEACRLLIETHGYHSAWIALVEDGKPVEPFHSAGFGEEWAPWRNGYLPGTSLTALRWRWRPARFRWWRIVLRSAKAVRCRRHTPAGGGWPCFSSTAGACSAG